MNLLQEQEFKSLRKSVIKAMNKLHIALSNGEDRAVVQAVQKELNRAIARLQALIHDAQNDYEISPESPFIDKVLVGIAKRYP
ncbi:hypothetical protein L1D41_01185 [Vibrio harveyi]|uniref:hypothetical protein n=1 Tax=Vibrio harveyi group TaxID=717610 RepID=UPI0007AFB622|nr:MULTISPECIES: hypothetical protein [Vibrio harveyi group]MCG9608289.1 hypothetical protein [Vibrio harveyi]MCG9666984.1 hypothetical protein [Vibrio harveyi]